MFCDFVPLMYLCVLVLYHFRAMPERAQQIGMMVGLGVDAVQWRRITDE